MLAIDSPWLMDPCVGPGLDFTKYGIMLMIVTFGLNDTITYKS